MAAPFSLDGLYAGDKFHGACIMTYTEILLLLLKLSNCMNNSSLEDLHIIFFKWNEHL